MECTSSPSSRCLFPSSSSQQRRKDNGVSAAVGREREEGKKARETFYRFSAWQSPHTINSAEVSKKSFVKVQPLTGRGH